MIRAGRALLGCLALAFGPAAASAQRAADLVVGASAVVPGPTKVRSAPVPTLVSPAADGAGWRTGVLPPLASAVLPGSGQALLGQDRFVAYLAVESYAWLRYAADAAEARRQRRDYRALASRVARAAFGDPRPTGDFEYYERMKHWIESGAFDLLPGGAIDPETDTTTYNGAMWLLARRTFWTDPDAPPPPGSRAFEDAMGFYVRRAVAPAFRWSWRGAELEQDIFARTIDRSNDAYRRAFEDLGVVLANHVLATVDAYVTVRLRARREPGGDLGLEAIVPWSPEWR